MTHIGDQEIGVVSRRVLKHVCFGMMGELDIEKVKMNSNNYLCD